MAVPDRLTHARWPRADAEIDRSHARVLTSASDPKRTSRQGLILRSDPVPFEVIFMTDEPDSNPAAEIQYGGQRLCVIRLRSGKPEIEFVQDLYVGKPVGMTFELNKFTVTLKLATGASIPDCEPG